MTTGDRATTGIGSLPHHNIDAAITYSFKLGIPFLPQIPIRNAWEFMIAQALEGIPGLQVEKDGSIELNSEVWQSRSQELDAKLAEAFRKSSTDKNAFEDFEPSPSISSCWQPFVWELEENHVPMAKVQIAGPLTCQWVLKTPELGTQIFRLILARSLAMTRRLQKMGIQPLLFLDEPGLYAFSAANPHHVLAMRELEILIQTLRKEGVLVGLHCCSNTDWNQLLALPLHVLSLDAELSLKALLHSSGLASTGTAGIADIGRALEKFIASGGRLALGVVPTARSSVLQSLSVEDLYTKLSETFSQQWPDRPEFVRKILNEAIYTPACGLALHSVADAELVLETLNDVYDYGKSR